MTASELKAMVKLYNAVVRRAEGVNLCANILDNENDDVAEFLENVIENAVECIRIAYVEGLEYSNTQFLEALYTLQSKVKENDLI